ncbi:TPA: 30S ribosomal protein S16 [Candidatus Saccharibacteria bacterium]|nr:30S ribosomal protein S16 [Candidatus Saccharibacteria bacterium]HRJ91281.1 30S ribosomal protein S16 [Candidatus Saccharibacteria bacterium]
MLAIRLQRVGRKGYPVYRVAVQEAWRHPSSGRVVAYVGSYNPHTKEANVQKEAAQKYLDNGAQPSPRVVKLLEDAGVKLPKWVEKAATDKQKAIRNAEKLRKNQPKEEPVAEEPAEEAPAEETPTEVVEPEEAPATEEAEKVE